MDWAPRVKAAQIRKLYRSMRQGVCDEDILLDVGWALYARCQDIVTAVTALQLGTVPCPSCNKSVQRQGIPLPTSQQQADLFRVHHRAGWFPCEHCQQRLLWQDCRDALRQMPRCLRCYESLQRQGTELHCDCGASWQSDNYRKSISQRVLLPCPHCHQRLRRPVFDRHPLDAPVGKQIRPEFNCSNCQARLVRSGPLLICHSCGHQVRWRSLKKSIKRRNETLSCAGCGNEFNWQAWRRRALDYSTGNPSPAFEFLHSWPATKVTDQRMMRVDILLQALHGQGALAPVFIEGSKGSIRQLLDELAAELPLSPPG